MDRSIDDGTHLYVNQALNLLYLWECTDSLDDIEITDQELGQLRLQVVAEFNEIDSPYTTYLVSKDRDVVTERIITGQRLFKEDKENHD